MRPRRAVVWRAHRTGRTGSALADDEVLVAVVTVVEVAVVVEQEDDGDGYNFYDRYQIKLKPNDYNNIRDDDYTYYTHTTDRRPRQWRLCRYYIRGSQNGFDWWTLCSGYRLLTRLPRFVHYLYRVFIIIKYCNMSKIYDYSIYITQ